MVRKEDRCILCGKKFDKTEDKICQTCRDFLKWKHKKKFQKRLEKLILYFSKNSDSTKFRRKK